MIPILVAYGTTEGQTRKIAEFIGKALQEAGYRVQLVDTASPQAANVQPVYAAAILDGSVHQDKHLGALTHFVKANVGWLNAMPTAFFSVSLTAALTDDGSRHETERMLQAFLQDTGLSALVLGPILLILNDAATVYAPVSQVAPAGLRTDVAKLPPAHETLRGPQARDESRAYRVWWKTDDVGGPQGKYLVNDAGQAVWLVDPGINGTVRTRPDGTEVRSSTRPRRRSCPTSSGASSTGSSPGGSCCSA